MKKDDWRDLSDANGDGYFDRHGGKEFKRYRPIPWGWLIIAAGSLFWTFCAHAQQTLVYTGQPMGSNLITGTVTLAEPLPANGVNVMVPASFSFTGDLYITTVNGYPSGDTAPSFTFTTVNGVITAWDIEFVLDAGSIVAVFSITSSGDSYSADTVSDVCQTTHAQPGQCTAINVSNTVAGAWSMSQAMVAPAMASMAAEASQQTANVAYLRSIYDQVQTQRDANWDRLVYLNTLANQLQAQVALCRANAGKC